ncbi:MAG: DUF2721 domain-containing protein [Balneolales bacterium]
MALDLTTPALLFPAISLLLLAYSNRFLAIASLIRTLHMKYNQDAGSVIFAQIDNLRRRIYLIKKMQIWGMGSLLLCVVCMFLLYIGYYLAGAGIFAISLIMLIVSLWQSILEIWISTEALNLELSDMESGSKKGDK